MADPTLPPTKFPEAYRQDLEKIVKMPAFLAAVQYLKEQNEAKPLTAPGPQDQLVHGALAHATQVGFHSFSRLLMNLATPVINRPDLPDSWKGQ